ncbi:MAG TPA: tetratricopeptide repeat protein [Pyrinomonadaceae bacterium]|jgi:tetratricopeptide (TPR) repeat protein
MTLHPSLARQLDNPALTPNNRAELRCQVAKQLEETGDYEAAREALGDLWQRVGEQPHVEGLEPSTAAEVLLRAGTLTGWIGSSNQLEGAQETAKNLLSESCRIFEAANYTKKILEAQTELAYCYWRQGENAEARIILESVLERLTTDSELRAKAVLRLAIVEWGAGRYDLALGILTDFAPLFDKINSHSIKGGYYNQIAVLLITLSASEKRGDYIDRALVEYAAASYHFEQAGHIRYCANVENNLGLLFYEASRFKEAHEHLDRARRIMVSLKDKVLTARVDETRARVYLAQGQTAEAERIARLAVRALENGGHAAQLAEVLITHGRALARLTLHEQSRLTFQRAIEAAQQAGATSRAGEAALAMVEELGERLVTGRKAKEAGCDGLDEEMKRHEAELIRQALYRAQGSVTGAARLLGLTHQRLSYMLQHRHKELMTERKPIVRRRRGVFKR